MKDLQNILPELPTAFLNRMATLLGDEFDDYLSSLNQPPSVGIRVNTLKISPESFIHISPYKLSLIPWCSSGFTIEDLSLESGHPPPGKNFYHTAGLYYLQEPSAMAAVEAMSPKPGEKVLDLAAAPGGKATHLAALMKNTGFLVANEIHGRRVWDLAENLERCGVTNAAVTNETPQRLAKRFSDYFDRVLLDAPCSGEGMFRKSEIARKEWKPDSPRSCAMRQSAILEQAAHMVKPGGCLAYTTCTFSPEENEGVIARFLEYHPEFDLMIIEKLPGLSPSKPEWIGLPADHIISKTFRIWPHLSSGEGHYIALLLKNSSIEINNRNNRNKEYSLKKAHIQKEFMFSRGSLDDFASMNLNLSFEDRSIHIDRSYVYCLPENSPNLNGLKVIHPGWWIGSIQKDRFTPSHALAMGIKADQAINSISFHLEDKTIAAYLGGESFSNSGENEWVLITIDGFSIGWGKRVQNVVKNYYPHGLRLRS